jgi:hypothetical protein
MSENTFWAGFIPKWFNLRKQLLKSRKRIVLRLLLPLVFPVKPICGGNYRNHHGITPGEYRRSFFSTNSEAEHFPGISLVSGLFIIRPAREL